MNWSWWSWNWDFIISYLGDIFITAICKINTRKCFKTISMSPSTEKPHTCRNIQIFTAPLPIPRTLLTAFLLISILCGDFFPSKEAEFDTDLRSLESLIFWKKNLASKCFQLVFLTKMSKIEFLIKYQIHAKPSSIFFPRSKSFFDSSNYLL